MQEYKKVTEEMRAKLRAPLPSEAVTPHPTKTYLSSIKAIYVTERLSDVFGVGAWRYKVESVSTDIAGMVVVKVIFEIPEYNIYYESFGGNDNGGVNSKNFDLGDAYKGATTDALTKIGSYLEIGIDVFKGKVKLQQAATVAKPPVKPVQSTPPNNKACTSCGAPLVLSQTKGTFYCSAKCWLKSPPINPAHEAPF